MTVSAAKLEANRRNAAKSCGPTSEEGKNRSKLNAVKHGMRAATLVLLDEDAQALDGRTGNSNRGLGHGPSYGETTLGSCRRDKSPPFPPLSRSSKTQ